MVAVAVEALVVAESVVGSKPRRRSLSPGQEARRSKLVASLTEPNVIAEEDRLLETQYYAIASAFKPRNGWQDWLSARIATLVVRINRSERIERKLRDLAAYRAFDFWEDDQKLAVETLAARIGRDPSKVVAKLRQTPAGVDWLVARWRGLARLEPEGWTVEVRGHAANLLGGDDSVDATAPGFAASRIVDLEANRDRIVEADALLRGLVEADLSDADVPNLARLRRQVREWHRQLKWYVDQFHVEHADRWDDPMRRPASDKVPPDRFRERNMNHFDGPPPSPIPNPTTQRTNVETKPIPVQPTLPTDETKPSFAESKRLLDETKPFSPIAPFTASVPPVAPVPPVAVHDYSNEKGRNHSRPLRAGDPSREYARRLKRARRRTNLALAELD